MNSLSARSLDAGQHSYREEERAELWRKLGTSPSAVRELLHYCRPVFDVTALEQPPRLPLEDEDSVAAWEFYAKVLDENRSLRALAPYLPQLRFPVIEGMSQLDSYRAATRRGSESSIHTQATGLPLKCASDCRILLHPTAAGRIPVLVVPDRDDFVAVVQALTRKNEPVRIPPSMGAVMVAGYNNWDRIRRLREAFFQANPGASDAAWQVRFEAIKASRHLYQDRFIILGSGPYSGVNGALLGLTNAEWNAMSMLVRCEHECAHYITRRILGAMSNCIHDELLADAYALVSVTGSFQPAWFLRFMGLEFYPAYRTGGRLENYRGNPMLSEEAFRALQTAVFRAAQNIAAFATGRTLVSSRQRLVFLFAMAAMSLEDLAAARAATALGENFDRYLQHLNFEEN